MPIPKEKENTIFNYKLYQTWPEDERWELIDGEAFDMSPAPSTKHQKLFREIFGQIYNYLKDKPCELFSAPFDVRLSEMDYPEDQDIETVVQPDIVIICDKSKIDKKGCHGAPDIVVEIFSPQDAWASSELANDQPSTGYKDETSKLALYEKHGVKEYWIVNPEAEYIMIYHLEDNKYSKPDYLRKEDILESLVLKELKINLQDIFSHSL